MKFWPKSEERELLEYYRVENELLRKQVENAPARCVHVPVPGPEDMRSYHEAIAALTENPLYLFYLAQLRRTAVDGFEADGKTSPEYYRGMLAMVGMVFQDAKNARVKLLGSGVTDDAEI